MPISQPTITEAVAMVIGDAEKAIRVIEVVRQYVALRPNSLEDIFPGKRLVDKPMSRRQITQIATAAAVKAQDARTKLRHAIVVPIIQELIEKDPAIPLKDIAETLDARGVKPARGEKWSKSSVLFVMKKAGIERDGD